MRSSRVSSASSACVHLGSRSRQQRTSARRAPLSARAARRRTSFSIHRWLVSSTILDAPQLRRPSTNTSGATNRTALRIARKYTRRMPCYDPRMRLDELGLIGNCQYSALVSRAGAITWCCLPRFDSEPIFASLLDDEGGQFLVGAAGGEAGTQRYL